MSGKAEASGAAAGGAPQDEKMRAGTLLYTKAGLFALFGWMIWGNICFNLFEQQGGLQS